MKQMKQDFRVFQNLQSATGGIHSVLTDKRETCLKATRSVLRMDNSFIPM